MFIQVTVLALWIDHGLPNTRLAVARTAVTTGCYVVLWFVSYIEHVRCVRPSTVLSIYLTVSILLDLACVRTVLLLPYDQAVPNLLRVSFVAKILLLAGEVKEKRSLFRDQWKNESPEATSGVFNRALFIWVNGIFVKGYRAVLTIDMLAPLDTELLSASNPSSLIDRWKKG
jgi:hypothetical protein